MCSDGKTNSSSASNPFVGAKAAHRNKYTRLLLLGEGAV